ncbi:protein transport protein SEC13 [Schistosoma bovis]|uniref:Protein SEC13 homolog n=1 Tax=Schistosoma bovis TaxID=6184 RepID=A0A430QGT0_SCHBO|nr:protein transport protein SEC13 [Schistosoma bovis]
MILFLKVYLNYFQSVASHELATWWGLISSSSNLAGCMGSWISIVISSYATIFLGDLAWRAPFIFVGACCIISALLLNVYLRSRTVDTLNKIDSKNIPTKYFSPSRVTLSNQLFGKHLNSDVKHKGCDDTCQSLMSTSKLDQNSYDTSNQEKCCNEKTSRLSNNCQDKDFTENHDNGVTIQPVKVNITNQISKLFRILSPRQRLLLGTSASVHMCSTFLRYAIGDWIAIMLLNNKHGYSQSTVFSWPSRRIPLIIIQMLIASGTLCCLSWITNHNASLTILLIISLVLGITVIGTIALCGVLAVELAPPAFSGTAHALSALIANFGAILAGYPFAVLAEHINWSGAFLVAGIVCGLSVSGIQTIDTNHEDMIHDAQLDYYGTTLATASSDHSVKIFDVRNKKQVLIAHLRDHQGPVWSLSWSHPMYGSLLASCGYDRKVGVNSVSWAPSINAEFIFNPTLATTTTSTNTLIPPIKRLVSGGCDSLIKIWREDVSSGNPEWIEETRLDGHTDWVRDVAWCPSLNISRQLIASCGQDGRLIIWQSTANNDSNNENRMMNRSTAVNDNNNDNKNPNSNELVESKDFQSTQYSTFWRPTILYTYPDVVWNVSWSVTLWKENLEGTWIALSEIARGGHDASALIGTEGNSQTSDQSTTQLAAA